MMQFLLNIPKEDFYIVIGVMLGAVCALHLLSALLKDIIAKILQYANVTLHIVLLFVLLLAEVRIEVAVLIYMASVFFASLVAYVRFEIERRRSEGRENE